MKTKKNKSKKRKYGGVLYGDIDIETYSTLFNVSSQVKDSDIREAFEEVTESKVASIVTHGDIKQVTISTENNPAFIKFLDSCRLYLHEYPILKMERNDRRWVLNDTIDDDMVQDLTPDGDGTFYVQLALEPFQIPEPLPEIPKEPQLYVATELPERERASNTIGALFNKTNTSRTRRRSRYLQKVCSDSGVCIAFGIELKRLLDFFKFETFLFVSTITRIASGANGFVQLLEYKRSGYTSHAILKSPLDPESDSLSIEYHVGQYLNQKTAFLPCLITTYGLYRYTTPESKLLAKQGAHKISLTDCTGICLTAVKEVAEMCESDQLCILTEAFKGAKPLSDKLDQDGRDFFQTDGLSTLYLIYYTLSKLPEFTHFDLHPANVLLYEPVQGRCIEYRLHIEGIEVRFKSRYLPKIIDYGRSVCPQNKQLAEEIQRCDTEYLFGFSTMRFEPDERRDLSLLKMLYEYRKYLSSPLLEFIENVVERKTRGKIVVDVSDAEYELRELVLQNQRNNTRDYNHLEILGVLNIYGDRPMEFVSTP
jgi:hypothetical protein